MEALRASCSEEFQSIRNSQSQQTAPAENFKAEVLAINQKMQGLDSSITQQLRNLSHRINALEARPAGAQSASADGSPDPVGQPP
eukprot:95946-Alexandrium_andersonii.AAC.1